MASISSLAFLWEFVNDNTLNEVNELSLDAYHQLIDFGLFEYNSLACGTASPSDSTTRFIRPIPREFFASSPNSSQVNPCDTW
jgi:hypothetical protein